MISWNSCFAETVKYGGEPIGEKLQNEHEIYHKKVQNTWMPQHSQKQIDRWQILLLGLGDQQTCTLCSILKPLGQPRVAETSGYWTKPSCKHDTFQLHARTCIVPPQGVLLFAGHSFWQLSTCSAIQNWWCREMRTDEAEWWNEIHWLFVVVCLQQEWVRAGQFWPEAVCVWFAGERGIQSNIHSLIQISTAANVWWYTFFSCCPTNTRCQARAWF